MFALDVSGSGNGGVACAPHEARSRPHAVPRLQIARGIVSGLAIARCERRSARSVAALAVD